MHLSQGKSRPTTCNRRIRVELSCDPDYKRAYGHYPMGHEEVTVSLDAQTAAGLARMVQAGYVRTWPTPRAERLCSGTRQMRWSCAAVIGSPAETGGELQPSAVRF